MSCQVLLEILISTYFMDSRCVIVLTDDSDRVDIKIEVPFVHMSVETEVVGDLIFHHFGCQEIVIVHENHTRVFEHFEQSIRLSDEQFNRRRYIVCGGSVELFASQETIFVSEIAVITEDFEIFTNNYCEDHRFVKVDEWFPENLTFLYGGRNLFPDKLRDQRGRALRIGTFTYVPYSIIENGTIDGTEMNIILEFCRKYNLTPVFSDIKHLDWGVMFDNWTGTGMFGQIVEDEIDVAFAAIYPWLVYYPFVDYSKFSLRSGVTCIVPAPRFFVDWFRFLRPFKVILWSATCVIVFVNIFTVMLILHTERKTAFSNDGMIAKTWLVILGLYLVQPLKKIPSGKVIKYFLMLIFINATFLTILYNSGMSTVLTMPRYGYSIKTVRDLAESGVDWYATDDDWIKSITHSRDVKFLSNVHAVQEVYKTLKSNFRYDSERKLRQLTKRDDTAFVVERSTFGYYVIPDHVKRDVIANYRIMEQDIYYEFCVYMLRRNSVLLPLLNAMIHRIIQSGIAHYWETTNVLQYSDLKIQRTLQYYLHKKEREIVKIKMSHVEGIFMLYFIGISLGLVVFFCELTIDKCAN